MHVPYSNNDNQPIVACDDPLVPLVYFNIVRLALGSKYRYQLPNYESCVVPATGTVSIQVDEKRFANIGRRVENVWDGDPEAVYYGTTSSVEIIAKTDAEIFIAGAKYKKTLAPFAITPTDIDVVQYGSDETKTHRKIKHILGQHQGDRVGRLLVSELYTVGEGGWSGFPPHKHDEDRLPVESRHNEVYNFRFNPEQGFGLQLLETEEKSDSHHVKNGSTIIIDKGYHPCVAAPGYEMYYFTVLAGQSQRSLTQYFQPEHKYQVHTIPGIKDMIAKFK